MNKIILAILLVVNSLYAYEDLRKGIDMTGKTNVTASQMNQLVDNATVNTNRGLIIATATNPPASFSNYLWKDLSVDPPVVRVYSSTYGWTNLALPTNTVTTAAIENNSITGAKIALNTISNVNLKQNIVATTNIIDQAVTADKIKDGVITEAKLVDTTITGAKIANTTITGAKLVNGTITSNQLASATIADVNFTDGSIAAGRLGNSAVVRTNLAADSVDSTNIIAGTIAESDIADNSITGVKVKSNTLRSTNIISGGIDVTNLSANVPFVFAWCSATNTGTPAFGANYGVETLNPTSIVFSNTPPAKLCIVATARGDSNPYRVLYFLKGSLTSKTLNFTTVDTSDGARTWATMDFIVYGSN